MTDTLSPVEDRRESEDYRVVRNITVKVWRQAGPDVPGQFESHHIDEISHDASFLELLDVLNERLVESGQDAITFEHDCREGICGSCALMINGQAHGPQLGTAIVPAAHAQVRRRGRDRRRAVAGQGLPDHQGPDVRPARARPHHRGRRLHHVADGRRPRRQPDARPEAGRRRRRARRLCIGCGACVAACPNGAANLFTGAKVAHLNLLPQGQAERYRRVEAMVDEMDDHFGSCTNHGECEAACPKEISIDVIALMNADY